MSLGKIDVKVGIVGTVKSKSGPSVTHEIRLSKDGIVYCDCEGFRWRGHCSHIKELMLDNPGARFLVKAGLREKIAHLEKIVATLDE